MDLQPSDIHARALNALGKAIDAMVDVLDFADPEDRCRATDRLLIIYQVTDESTRLGSLIDLVGLGRIDGGEEEAVEEAATDD